MAVKKPAKKGFTAEERAAMKERAQELKRAGKGDGESDVLEKIAAMPAPDRGMAERLHAITGPIKAPSFVVKIGDTPPKSLRWTEG